MAIVKKFAKVGNSWGLVFDRSILELVDMRHDLPVRIEIGDDGESLVVRSISQGENKQFKFREALKEVNKRHVIY